HVQRVLVRTLKPDDIVIIDNLGSHKGKVIRRAIHAAGAKLLILPPYGPDLNPIEQRWICFRARQSRSEGRCRTSAAKPWLSKRGLEISRFSSNGASASILGT